VWTGLIKRLRQSTKSFDKRELDFLFAFSEPDLVWDAAEFEKYGVNDNPSEILYSNVLGTYWR